MGMAHFSFQNGSLPSGIRLEPISTSWLQPSSLILGGRMSLSIGSGGFSHLGPPFGLEAPGGGPGQIEPCIGVQWLSVNGAPRPERRSGSARATPVRLEPAGQFE